MPHNVEYSEVSPKRSSSVPVRWKVLQTLLFGITSVSGYACAILFGYWLQGLDAHCPLFAELKFTQTSDGNSSSATLPPLQLDLSASKWGRDSLCSFCQFVPLLSAVDAFIWAGFFACCGRGGRSSDGVEPWKLVFAAMAFSILFLPITMTASTFMTSGIEETCQNLAAYLVQINYVSEAEKVCTGVDLYELGIPVSSNLLFLQIAAWVSSCGWAVAGFLLLLRYLCLADWDLVQRNPDNPEQTRICNSPAEDDEPKEV